jgi:OB-fold nucleic acid binding domain.
MKQESKIIIILFIMAFSSVILLYSIVSEEPSAGFASETPVVPDKSDIGKIVYVEGTVLNKRMTYTGGNLIVNIECKDNSVVMIFVPKSSGAASLSDRVEVNDFIGVKGSVEEYGGSLEVVLKEETNLKKIK